MSTDPVPIPAEVLLHHAGFVRALAKGLLGDGALAEDVAQETLTIALRKRPDEESLLPAWLRRVATNVAWKLRRSETRRTRRERSVARDEVVGHVDEVERAEVLRRVTDAVLALDEPYRATVLARYYEGLASHEIAARLGVPESTVRSRLSRAHEKLRERLDRGDRGDRRAWSVALGAFTGVEPPLATAAASATVLIAMKTKVALVAVAVLAAVLSWRMLTEPAIEPSSGSETAVSALATEPPWTAIASPPIERRAAAGVATAPQAAIATEPYGTLVVRVVGSDRTTPLEGAAVKVLAWGSDDPFLHTRKQRTGADGTVRFERVHAGSIVVSTAGAASVGGTVELEPGAEKRIDLVVREGATLFVSAVDEHGAAVGDAEVWLSEYGNSKEGAVVARTGPDGRCRLEDVADATYVGVRSARHGPSPLFLLHAQQGVTIERSFVLRGSAGHLHGEVVDAAGRPIAGARVRVHEPIEGVGGGGTDGFHGGAPGIEGVTDPHGGFEFEGLRTGPARIDVRMSGYAPESESAHVGQERTSLVRITLLPGAGIHGIVRTDDGTPVAGAFVGVGGYGDFLSAQTRSRADGSFHLESLEPGMLTVRASERARGEAVAELATSAREEAEWNPVLDLGRIYRGIVVDERGSPLVGWTVGAQQSSSRDGRVWARTTKTDDHGRFRLAGWPTESVRVLISENANTSTFASFAEDDVAFVEVEREFRIGAERRNTARLRGRVVAEDGQPAHGSVDVHSPALRQGKRLDLSEEGGFETGLLPSGSWDLVVLDRDGRHRCARTVEVAPLQTLDLGPIVLAPPGRAFFDATAEAAIDLASVGLGLFRPGSDLLLSSTRLTDANDGMLLAPGNYVAQVAGQGILHSRHPFEVAPGGETRVAIPLVRAASRIFRLSTKPGSALPDRARVVVSDNSGRIVEDHEVERRDQDLSLYVVLVPGEYVVRATAAGGLAGEARVETNLNQAQPIEIVLE